jgi:hypothetical protein
VNLIPGWSMAKRAGAKAVEVKGSHAVYVSQPCAVTDLIQRAAVGAIEAATKRLNRTAFPKAND